MFARFIISSRPPPVVLNRTHSDTEDVRLVSPDSTIRLPEPSACQEALLPNVACRTPGSSITAPADA